MKHTIVFQLILYLLVIFVTACGQVREQNESIAEEESGESSNLETFAEPSLGIIEPTIRFTPDISVNAKKNLERTKELFAKIDSIINLYPDYETAQEHLSKRQIEIWENEEEYEIESVNIYGIYNR